MLAFLQLIRLPTVFSAMADIILGYSLTHQYILGPDGWDDPQKFFGLLVSSCCLYMSGMVFNDVFDLKQDAAERPGRPIPSGRIPLKAAIGLGALLMLGGVAAAAFVSVRSLQVAGLLVLSILAYDRVLKRTPLGPLAMGACRLLNVLLGASASVSPTFLEQPQLIVSIGLGIYIVGVTVFARTEAKTSSRWQLGLAQVLFNLGIIVLGWLIMTWPKWEWPAHDNRVVAVAMLAFIAFTLNRNAVSAMVEPSPQTVQNTVRLLLLSYVMIDATLVFWKFANSGPYGTGHAILVSLLIVPAIILGRFIPMT